LADGLARSLLILVAAVAALFPASAVAAPGTVAVALTGNSLITLDPANPGAAGAPVAVTGLTAGDSLVAIDFRPQNGFLYGLGRNSGAGTVQLYAISYRTGVAAALGSPGTFVASDGVTPAPVAGTNFGFDFNPAVDRVRVVNDAGQNFRINPNNGALVDGDLFSPGLNMDGSIGGATTSVDAAAYTNNQPNATTTTLYTLGALNHQLFIQNPPNVGTQTTPLSVTVGGTPASFSGVNGFDIAPGVDAASSNTAATGVGYAALTIGGITSMYTIDLTSGAATSVGPIGAGGAPVGGLAVQGEVVAGGMPAIALNGNQLVRFNTGAPGTATAVAVTGLLAGETIVGIDWRPQVGELQALGHNPVNGTGSATLYRLDPQTGAATIIGGANGVANGAGSPISLAGASLFGFDFNPTVDRIRVVTNNGVNFRLNPSTGGLSGSDGAINGLPPGATGVTGAAYANSYGQSLTGGVTTLYDLEPSSNTLFIQTPPNNGLLTSGLPVTLGGSVLDFTSANGFDIPAAVAVTTSGSAASGSAYAGLTVAGVAQLYRIELGSGAASALGAVGSASALGGLALGDAPPVRAAPPPPGPPNPPADLSPSIGSFSLTNRTFRVGARPRGASKRVKTGTTFRLSLSEAARVTFAIERRTTGRRVRGRCRAASRRNRKAKRCTRFVSVGSFSRDLQAGQQRVNFSGRVRGKALKPGSYRATARARDGANQLSSRVTVAFRIVR
jgi:hypothetical protein